MSERDDKHDELIRALRTQDPHDTDEVIKVMNAAARVLESLPSAERATDVETVRALLEGFNDDTPVSEVRAMLERQFGAAPARESFDLSATLPSRARDLLEQAADRICHSVTESDDGRTDPLLADIYEYLGRAESRIDCGAPGGCTHPKCDCFSPPDRTTK